MIESEKNMIRELALNGYTDPQIAEIMNYSRVHIGTIRRELGIKAKRGGKRIVTEQVLAQMRELNEQGLSYERIANVLNISRYTVGDYLTGKLKV